MNCVTKVTKFTDSCQGEARKIKQKGHRSYLVGLINNDFLR